MWKPHGIAEVDDVILGCLWSWPKALPELIRGSIVAKNYSNKIAVIVSTKQFSWFTLTMLGRSLIRHDHLFYPWTGPPLLEAPQVLPCAWIMPSACLSWVRSCPRTQPSDSIVVLRSSGLGTLLNSVKASIQTFKIWLLVRKLLILLLPKTSLFSKFSYLLKLPPTNME